MDLVETSTVLPRFMEVEGQSGMDRLCNFKLLKTNFDAIFDGLETDGNNFAELFVDWESAGPVYSFDELRNALCGEAKFCFNADHSSSALHTPEGIRTNFGPPQKLNWLASNSKDIPTI